MSIIEDRLTEVFGSDTEKKNYIRSIHGKIIYDIVSYSLNRLFALDFINRLDAINTFLKKYPLYAKNRYSNNVAEFKYFKFDEFIEKFFEYKKTGEFFYIEKSFKLCFEKENARQNRYFHTSIYTDYNLSDWIFDLDKISPCYVSTKKKPTKILTHIEDLFGNKVVVGDLIFGFHSSNRPAALSKVIKFNEDKMFVKTIPIHDYEKASELTIYPANFKNLYKVDNFPDLKKKLFNQIIKAKNDRNN